MNENSALGSVIESGSAALPPFLGKLIHHAPESFKDPRAGQVAVTVRAMRHAGEPVNSQTVAEKHLPLVSFILCELCASPLSLDAAEFYAAKFWNEYQARKIQCVLAEAHEQAISKPEQAVTIAAAACAALSAVADETTGLKDRLASRVYSPQVKPIEPTSRFSLAGVPICTPANLTTISGQAKAGKSAVVGSMIGSTFAASDSDCLGFFSENPHGHAVVLVDTEQCPFDHWAGTERIARRAGIDPVPAWLRSYCLTGFSASDVRLSIRLLTEQAVRDFGGVHSVFVDGAADAAQDVNDPAESNSLVTELHALAIKFDCPIINIIHVNPGSDFKTRGHLGSQLERKSETNLRLEKDDNGATVIWADKNRRAPIPKNTAPRFAWNDEARMHVTVASQRSSKDAADKQAMQIEAEAVFTAAGNALINYGKFISLLEREVHASKSTAKRRFGQMLRTQIIRKELTGFYELANK
jgi:hypothetical protein